MSVTFLLFAPCLYCGYEARGVMWSRIKPALGDVIRTVGVNLAYLDRTCVECGGPISTTGKRLVLDAESPVRLTEWRDRQRARRQERRAS